MFLIKILEKIFFLLFNILFKYLEYKIYNFSYFTISNIKSHIYLSIFMIFKFKNIQ
jgi:hypothetical protein